MFKKDLTEKLQKIFDLKKVTFDRPSEAQEQECIFVEVETARCRVKDARELARVTGTLHIYASYDRLPYGYFAKKIAQAKTDLTRDLFFFDFEENVSTFLNIVERSIGFIYLFDSQYDPDLGTLNQLNLSISESE